MPLHTHPDAWLERVAQWITSQQLLRQGDAVLIGVSGGSDSVGLLRALQLLGPRWAWRVVVGHVHHGVRGVSADRDAAFVQTLAAQWDLPYVCEQLPYAPGAEVSEAQARADRYAALLRMSERHGLGAIALGHTLDDHVETVLMWLIRGTGVQGLRGVPVTRSLTSARLVRPVRGMWRADIERWLRGQRIAWCLDETNAQRTHLRNRIRTELLPLLEEHYNPQIKQGIVQLAETAEADWHLLEEMAARWLHRHGLRADQHYALPVRALRAEPVAVQQAIVRRAVRQLQGHLRQFTYQHWRELNALLTERPDGSIVHLPWGTRAQKRGHTLELRVVEPSAACSPS